MLHRDMMGDKDCSTEFIIDSEFEKQNKASFYDDYYTKVNDSNIKWRDFSAIEKCKSIITLCSGKQFGKVVEIGCGLCSITSRLGKLNFAPELYALEVSPSAVYFIKEKINIPSLKSVYLLDTTKTPFENDFFDLGILSHVIEHVSDPTPLINEALRICKYVLIEVPLEDCLLLNLSSSFWEKVTGRKRTDNAVGHVQFFNKSAVGSLIMKSRGIVIRERTYRSWRLFYLHFRPIILLRYLQSIIFYLAFKMTNSRIVETNYAVLIRKSPSFAGL
jgi:SAM-dependent methyltransferase